MKKLTDIEVNACRFLAREGSYSPGLVWDTAAVREILNVMDSLVKKKRAFTEDTDDGPVFHLTAQGEVDAA